MMLKRYRNYAHSNPLPSWLIGVAFLLVFYLTLFWAVPGTKNPGLLMFYVVLAFSLPTSGLIQRLSEDRQHEAPVPLRQEEGVGLLSLSALGASFGTLGVIALLSLGLGYAARRSEAGRWGLRLSSAWLVLFIGVACFVLLLRHL